jgi:DNA-binding response OmpR family regulator
MLTALGEAVHKVEGLDAGADDYLAKPFSFDELLARLRALLRRPPLSEQETMLEVGPLRMDTKRRTVTLNGTRLNLRPKEYALLELLMRHPDEVHARAVIAERVWGDAFYLSDNTLDVTVSGLRQSLEWNRPASGIAPQPAPRIETIRGVGYRLVAGEAAP